MRSASSFAEQEAQDRPWELVCYMKPIPAPPPTQSTLCSYLLVLVLCHVRFELEIGVEFAGAELALVRAIDQDNLLGFQFACLALIQGAHVLGWFCWVR